VHLADDHALSTINDEGAVVRHERHVAHVNILLLDIEDRTRFGFRINLKHDQAQRDLHRCSISNPALTALLSVEFGIFEFVVNKIKLCRARKVANGEHAAQRLFQTRYIANRRIRTQELLIRFALNLNQIRHLCHFVNVPKHFADALLRGGNHCLGRCCCLFRHKNLALNWTLPDAENTKSRMPSYPEDCSFQRLEIPCHPIRSIPCATGNHFSDGLD
jgi:hypothetical protein